MKTKRIPHSMFGVRCWRFDVLLALLLLLVAANICFGQPVITNQPAAQAVTPGTTATFQVGATGTGLLAYQWQRNAGVGFSDLADRTNAVLTLTNAQPWDAWDYRVVVTSVNGARISTVAHLYVMSPAALTSREVLDTFDDNLFTGRVEARGSVIESNQQFNVFGSFPVPTHSMYDSYVIAGYPTTWTVTNGMTLEWRTDLISLDENATNTAILTVGSDTGGGYIFHKGREFAFLLKWSSSGSYCFLSCERAALSNTNLVLALALTRMQPNLVLTTRVLDKADPNTVLYQHSVVDTPNADPTLTASQFQGLTGIQLNDLATDAPGTPPTTDAAWLGVFQNTDGTQPVPKATFDNLELWTSTECRSRATWT